MIVDCCVSLVRRPSVRGRGRHAAPYHNIIMCESPGSHLHVEVSSYKYVILYLLKHELN